MKTIRFVPLLLAAFLQLAPFVARLAPATHALAPSPAAIVLKWVVGALALAGTYHTVSAATGLVSPSTVQGKTGSRLSYQIKLTGREVGRPKSWGIDGQILNAPGSTIRGMPPGLSFNLGTGIISGTPTQAGTFDVTIFAYEHANARGGALSFTLTFQIEGTAMLPAITTPPLSQTAIMGMAVTFTVAATGTEPLSYQWNKDGAALPGATAPTLAITSVAAADAGDYFVIVSNAAGSTPSASATLTVTMPATPLEVTVAPRRMVVHVGEKFTLMATAAGGSGALTYQWSRNGAEMSGATAQAFTVAAATDRDAGEYTVRTTPSSGGAIVSATCTVLIVPLVMQAPVLSSSGLTLQLQTIPERRYVIESTSSLETPAWQPGGEITATDRIATFRDSTLAGPQRFWRYRPTP